MGHLSVLVGDHLIVTLLDCGQNKASHELPNYPFCLMSASLFFILFPPATKIIF